MKTWITKKGQKIDQVIAGRSNAFTVTSGAGRLLVDSGGPKTWTRLQQALDEGAEGTGPLKVLMLTHCHFDHAENAAAVKARYGARIVVHRGEADFLSRGENPPVRGTMRVNRLIVALLGKRLLSRATYTPVDWDVLVDERYDLGDMGFHAYALHTPGHSPGSISLVVDDEIAIVGDAIFGIFRGSVLPPFALDRELMVRSWKKLLDTGCSTFLPAHGSERGRDILQKQYDKHAARP